MISYWVLQVRFLVIGLIEAFSLRNKRSPFVPPPRLRYRVHGSVDIRGYFDVGIKSWQSIETILANRQWALNGAAQILDFGCGSGRVLRNIPTTEAKNVWGIDIDHSAIRWCQRHLPEYRFSRIDPSPPTQFENDSFDLIFSISVFTHLDESRQNSWLEEISRILKPGGLFIASVHGDYHRELRKRKLNMEKGFLFNDSQRRFFKKDGLPRFYQDAHHTKEYVLKNWSHYFKVLDYIDRGIVDHHDAVVLTK